MSFQLHSKFVSITSYKFMHLKLENNIRIYFKFISIRIGKCCESIQSILLGNCDYFGWECVQACVKLIRGR